MRLLRKRAAKPRLTGNCPIREHTGDGDYVGRCDFACYDDACPRHGLLSDYPTHDDREVDAGLRQWPSGASRERDWR